MHIVHYHRDLVLETGGVVRAVLDICSCVHDESNPITLIASDLQDAPPQWLDSSSYPPDHPTLIKIDPPSLKGGRFSSNTLQSLRTHLARADVLHLHGMWDLFNAQLASLARSLNLPYIVSPHGMLDDWSMSQKHLKKRLYLALTGRRLLKNAAAVHCTAQAELNQAKKWFPKGQGTVVPLVMDLDPYQTLPGPEPARKLIPELNSNRPILLFLSRLHYKKGVEHLIHTTDLLRKRGTDVLTVIAGSGDAIYTRKLHDLTAELNLNDHIIFPGFVSGVEKISLFQSADLFVLPTSQENFGFVFFEALAAGTPVITTRGVDTWPELEESGGGVIADGNAESFSASIASLLSDNDAPSRMGALGRSWVFENLSRQNISSKFLHIYKACA